MPSLPSLYRLLFGKDHIQDGDVISLSEHGRAGGVSTGQGFKFSREVDETQIIDEASETVTYIGWAIPGSNTTDGKADARWKIKKIDETTNPTVIGYADGNDNYDNVWDDRASLSYS